METQNIGPTQGTIDTSNPENVILDAKCDGEDMIFAWDVEKPTVVMVRRVHGLSTRKPDEQGRVSPPMPQNASIVAYAMLSNPKASRIMVENLGTTSVPIRLEIGTHMIRVQSAGASGLRVQLVGTEVEPLTEVENERESRVTNENHDNSAENTEATNWPIAEDGGSDDETDEDTG